MPWDGVLTLKVCVLSCTNNVLTMWVRQYLHFGKHWARDTNPHISVMKKDVLEIKCPVFPFSSFLHHDILRSLDIFKKMILTEKKS